MKKPVIVVLAAVCMLHCASASETNGVKKLTPTERRALGMQKAGGRIAVPKSQKGSIRILNAQSRLPVSEINNVVETIAKSDEYRFDVQPVAADGVSRPLLRGSGNCVTVAMIDRPDEPPLAVAPDEGWAVVNVRALTEGLSTPEATNTFFAARCRKQLIRGIVLAATGTGSQYKKNFFWAKSIPDLDLFKEFLPMDSANNLRERLADRGVTPLRYTVYARACREGWAPAPTNDVQKAIWDEVHTIPDKPIKIEFDPKRDVTLPTR